MSERTNLEKTARECEKIVRELFADKVPSHRIKLQHYISPVRYEISVVTPTVFHAEVTIRCVRVGVIQVGVEQFMLMAEFVRRDHMTFATPDEVRSYLVDNMTEIMRPLPPTCDFMTRTDITDVVRNRIIALLSELSYLYQSNPGKYAQLIIPVVEYVLSTLEDQKVSSSLNLLEATSSFVRARKEYE